MTERNDSSGLATRVRSAVFWRSGSQIAAQLLMWAATIVVVRLLDPQDYGLFAMSLVVHIALNFLNAQSFASSLVQEESVSKHRIAQVFGVLILFNIILGIAQVIAAPFVAAYYKQPVLTNIIYAQSAIYVLTPFIALPQVLLARTLNFRAQAKADLAGAISGALTALAGAWFGYGVWTLVAAPIVQQSVRAVILCREAGHLSWPSFNFRGMGTVFSFGSALILCQLFWVIQSQSDIVIAGRAIGPHQLGLYSEALFLALIFTAKFVPPLNEVAFPAYTQLGKSGGDIGKAFVTAARMMMFVALPLYFGMSAVARPMVETLLGEKWMEIVPLMEGLPLAMPFFALQIICSPTTNAMGRPKIYVLSSFAGALIMTLCFYVGLKWGLTGLVHAWQIGSPLLLAVTLALTLPAIGVRFGTLLKALAPSIAAAVAMYAVVHHAAPHVESLSALAELGILVTLGGATYLGLLWKFSKATITDLYRIIVKKEVGVMSGETEAAETPPPVSPAHI
jgi:O-antigen/teichoic acid export membrane protein